MPRLIPTLILSCLVFPLFAQNQSIPEYTSLEKALQEPEKVRVLNLNDQELESLPKEFAKLVNIEVLDLSFNNFKEIPPVVFSLPHLRELYFSGAYSYIDKFEGRWDYLLETLPEEIGKLSDLEVLALSHHRLSALPASFSKLKKLKKLDLWHNELTPKAIEILPELPGLEAINIGGNDLEFLPKGFKTLQSLRYLALDNSWSEGVPTGTGMENFPMEVLSLKNLEVLSLGGQYFEAVPDEINQLSKLKELYLYGVSLPVLPETITQLKDLQVLAIDLTCVGGQYKMCEDEFYFPKGICEMRSLREFHFSSRTVSEAELEKLDCLPELNKDE